MKEPHLFLSQLAEVISPPPLPWLATHPHLFVRKQPHRVAAAQEIMAHCWPEMIHRSVPSRQYEYVVGRLAVACLLETLDVPAPLRWLGSEGRRPVWPERFLGAISHTDDLVAVTAGPRHAGICGVGIDLERVSAQETFEDAISLCFTDRELMRLDSVDQGLVAGFSAKESLFKCLSVEAGGYFDFLDAEIVAVDPTSQELDIRLRRDLSPRLQRGAPFDAPYRFAHGHVWTGVAWFSNPVARPSSSPTVPCPSSSV